MTVKLSWDKIKKIVNSFRSDRPPEESDYLFPVPTIWMDESTDTPWLLIDVTGSVATWIEIPDAARVTALEDIYVRLEIFQEVSATSGSLSIPTGGVVVLDPYSEDEDALCTVIPVSGQRPIEELERTSSGSVVTVTLSGVGNSDYTLSGTPSGSQYAIQYVVDIQLIFYRDIDRDIILATDDVLSPFDEIKFNTTAENVTEGEGVLSWNPIDYTINIDTGLGPVLQVGQEFYTVLYNGTGGQLDNGTVVYPVGQLGGRPSVAPSVADTHEKIERPLYVLTMDIPDGAEGIGTSAGFVRGLDTSTLALGTEVYLSTTVEGGYVSVKPEFPNYAVRIGGVTKTGVSDGEIFVAISGSVQDTFRNFWNGTFRETFNFTVTEAGGVITGNLEPDNGHPDMTMIFSDGFTLLDTDPAATITLTAGTDANPQVNFVYVPKNTKVLTVSTSDWPVTEHIKVSTVVLRTAATTATDDALGNHNHIDHVEDTTTFQGHMTHITDRLRQEAAKWHLGAEGTVTIVGASSPDDVFIAVTSGVVYQLHRHTFPALDMQTGDDIHIVNDSVSPYDTVTNLNTQILDSVGGSLSNKHFSFVVWGIQNRSGETSHLMLNLPSGSYNSSVNAIADADGFTNYSIPSEFTGTGFLIARYTFNLSSAGSGTWTLNDTVDLRGSVPNTSAGGGGGGGGVSSWLALSDTPSSFAGQALKIPQVNAGETAIELVDKDHANNIVASLAYPASGHTGFMPTVNVVTDYDAKADVQLITGDNARGTGGTTTVEVDTVVFVSGTDDNKTIQIVGAGAAGGLYQGIISSVTSTTIIEVSPAITITVTDADVRFATETSATIQAAIDSLQDNDLGGVVYIPTGTYWLDTQLDITNNNIILQGEGACWFRDTFTPSNKLNEHNMSTELKWIGPDDDGSAVIYIRTVIAATPAETQQISGCGVVGIGISCHRFTNTYTASCSYGLRIDSHRHGRFDYIAVNRAAQAAFLTTCINTDGLVASMDTQHNFFDRLVFIAKDLAVGFYSKANTVPVAGFTVGNFSVNNIISIRGQYDTGVGIKMESSDHNTFYRIHLTKTSVLSLDGSDHCIELHGNDLSPAKNAGSSRYDLFISTSIGSAVGANGVGDFPTFRIYGTETYVSPSFGHRCVYMDLHQGTMPPVIGTDASIAYNDDNGNTVTHGDIFAKDVSVSGDLIVNSNVVGDLTLPSGSVKAENTTDALNDYSGWFDTSATPNTGSGVEIYGSFARVTDNATDDNNAIFTAARFLTRKKSPYNCAVMKGLSSTLTTVGSSGHVGIASSYACNNTLGVGSFGVVEALSAHANTGNADIGDLHGLRIISPTGNATDNVYGIRISGRSLGLTNHINMYGIKLGNVYGASFLNYGIQTASGHNELGDDLDVQGRVDIDGTDDDVQLTVRASVGQTKNLQEWQDSNSVNQAFVGPKGELGHKKPEVTASTTALLNKQSGSDVVFTSSVSQPLVTSPDDGSFYCFIALTNNGTVTSPSTNIIDVDGVLKNSISIPASPLSNSKTLSYHNGFWITTSLGLHSIADHDDTAATGVQLTELTNGSKTALHEHDAPPPASASFAQLSNPSNKTVTDGSWQEINLTNEDYTSSDVEQSGNAIKCLTAGTYKVASSFLVSSPAASVVSGALFLNGSSGTGISIDFDKLEEFSGTYYKTFSVSSIYITLAVNDLLTLEVFNTDASNDLTIGGGAAWLNVELQ